MAEVIRDVLIRVGVETKDVRIELPGIGDAIKQAKEFERIQGQIGRSTQAQAQTIGQAQAKVNDRQREMAEAAKASKEEIEDLSIKAAEGFTALAAGGLTAARGLTFLGITADDSLAKVTEQLALVQGGIDLITGAKDMFKGMIEGARAARTALTSVQGGLAGLLRTIGPVGVGLGAVTLAVGAGALAWRLFSRDTSKAKEDLKETGEAASAAGKQVMSLDAQLQSARTRFQRRGASNDRLSFMRDEGLIDSFQSERNFLAQQERRQFQEFAGPGGQASLISGGDFLSLLQASGIDSVQGGRDRIEKFGQNESIGFENQVKIAESLKDLDDARLSIHQRRLENLREESQVMRDSLSSAREGVKLAREQLDMERGRVESLDERIGRLNTEQQIEFKLLAERVKAGEKLNKDQLSQLEALGGEGVSGFTRQRFAEFGREAGGASLFDAFQGRAQRGAGSQLEELAKALQQREDKEKELLSRLPKELESNAELQRKTIDLLARIFEDRQVSEQRLNDLERRQTVRSLNGGTK